MALKPLGDRIVVRFEETEEKTASGFVLAGASHEATKTAEVLADEKSEVSLGEDANALKEKAIKVTASAVMKDGLPTFLFLDYFPDSTRTISSTITMRRED